MNRLTLVIGCTLTLWVNLVNGTERNLQTWPKLTNTVAQNAEVEARVQALLATMTPEQKIAQMIQPEIRDITVEDMRRYGFGSYLNGGGSFPAGNKHATVGDWIELAESMYQASIDASLDGSSIPTMWGTDAVHGHNNVIGATLFPHNIGLGAARNPRLIEDIAQATALEVLATGIDWIFAPTVATVRDDRWGRTYEGYSEDPEIVKDYAQAVVHGLQGSLAGGSEHLNPQVIATLKHFIGDGGTVGGDDQGNNIASEEALMALHSQGYISGIQAGALTVMASFNSWHGEKIHGSKYLLTDVLKERFGFAGLVVGDWAGHGQIPGCTNESCPEAVNAGLDVFMVPGSAWKPLYENTLAQLKSGEISQARVDDAVTRILRVKFLAGLFDNPSPAQRQYAGNTQLIGAAPHRAIARQAVRESLVLLKNRNGLLPLAPQQHFLVAGDGAHNIGKQSGGWSITWQGTGNQNEDFPGASSIYQGFAEQVARAGGTVTLSENGEYEHKPDVAIVVFGEDPYAEGHGDRQELEYQGGNKKDLALLKRLSDADIPVVAVFLSGRPMWVNAEINQSDAFVAAWLPGSEGAGVADVLLRDVNGAIQHPMVGRLSFSWPKSPTQLVNRFDQNNPPLLPYGFGLRYGQVGPLDEQTLSEQSDASSVQALPKALFTGTVQPPWLLWLESDKRYAINQNTLDVTNLSYRTLDRLVQEDAMQVSAAQEGSGQLMLASRSSFREDLSPQQRAGGALTFMLKAEPVHHDKLALTMSCDNPELERCGARLTLAPYLATTAQWQRVAIPMSCFSALGMEFQNTVVPFALSLHSGAIAAISDIQFAQPAQALECFE